jgi:activating signal cointegrator 1
MKALTLTQPWATLVAIGAKRIETRSWRTSYTGPLAIHAAKGYPKWAKDISYSRLFVDVFLSCGLSYRDITRLPTGVVVATCELANCASITNRFVFRAEDGAHERDFGDYTPGRYAWILGNVKALPEPIPATGAQGLWEWERPYQFDSEEEYFGTFERDGEE